MDRMYKKILKSRETGIGTMQKKKKKTLGEELPTIEELTIECANIPELL